MTNYLDEYNKRMTYGNAMGFNASPLAQTAHMHADRDRQQSGPVTYTSNSTPAFDVKFGGGNATAGFPLAILLLVSGVTLLCGSVWVIESTDGILPIIALGGALIGFLLSAFGAVATLITSIAMIGALIRRKIFWGIAAIGALSGFSISTGTGISVFLALLLGWGVVEAGRKIQRRFFKPASTPDQP